MPTSAREPAMTSRMSRAEKSPSWGPVFGSAAGSGTRRQSAGWAPRYSGLMKLLSRCAGSTRALVGGRFARSVRHLFEDAAERVGRTRHRRGTERGDAVLRQQRRHRRDRIAVVQRVVPLDAVHVHVDEPGHDVAVSGLDNRGARRIDARRSLNRRDAIAVDDEGCAGENPVRQDNVAAGNDDHGWIFPAPGQST